MARKKEQAVMVEVGDEAEFNQFLDQPGLAVVDVYQAWCGPCKPVQALFKRLKVELGQSNVSYATADMERIPQLVDYAGDCEPVFLLYGGGYLLGCVRGCNAPVIEKQIRTQVQNELDIAAGKMTRIPMCGGGAENDAAGAAAEEAIEAEVTAVAVEEEESTMGTHEIDKHVSCLIIKPDIIEQTETVAEIIEMIELNGIEILMDETRQLNQAEIDATFPCASDQYKSHMASGPSRLLAVTKGEAGLKIIKLCRDMCGPIEPATAIAQSPKSIRARFGTDLEKNAIHCSESNREAKDEIKTLFPDFNAPKASPSAQLRDDLESRMSGEFKTKTIKEQTITLIRPSANAQHQEAILSAINNANITIVAKCQLQLSDAQFVKLYAKHIEQEYYQPLKDEMLSGESLVLHLEAESVISEWRRLIGPMLDAKEHAPDSLRALYQVGEVNPIHAASNASQVKLELDTFFGSSEAIQQKQPVPTESATDQLNEQAEVDQEQAAAESAAPAEEEVAAPAEEPAATPDEPAAE